MTEDHDQAVEDWFQRSAETLPPRPFVLEVLQQVQRHERVLRVQRYAALLVAALAILRLLPELIVPLDALAALPLAIVASAGDQWPLLVVSLTGFIWWLTRQLRRTGLFSGI